MRRIPRIPIKFWAIKITNYFTGIATRDIVVLFVPRVQGSPEERLRALITQRGLIRFEVTMANQRRSIELCLACRTRHRVLDPGICLEKMELFPAILWRHAAAQTRIIDPPVIELQASIQSVPGLVFCPRLFRDRGLSLSFRSLSLSPSNLGKDVSKMKGTSFSTTF